MFLLRWYIFIATPLRSEATVKAKTIISIHTLQKMTYFAHMQNHDCSIPPKHWTTHRFITFCSDESHQILCSTCYDESNKFIICNQS